jgi:PIN domain nuclease of toxin-antitoxin system
LNPLLDTHVWLWWLTSADGLARRERRALDQLAADERPFLSAISMWEAQLLVTKGRFTPPSAFESWLPLAASPETVTVLPLDIEVVLELQRLPVRFHGDPADRLIVATARAHGLPLATHDHGIRRSRAIKLWRP